jgi:hypothetical protein
VHRFRDGSGQIVLALDRAVRVSWWLLWPHVRAGRLRWPEPLLRGLDDVDGAAAALRAAAADLSPELVEAAVAAARAAEAPAGPPVPTAPPAARAAARPIGRVVPAGTSPARPAHAGTSLAST